MKISMQLTDQAIAQQLGARLAALRIARNLTQAALAAQSGVSKRTIERLEAGAVATQLSGFLRVCRALDLLDHIDALVPEPLPSPIALLKQQGRQRQRASKPASPTRSGKKWTWAAPE
jgi:transcriptional regulator with XRE-family HTH domain